MDEGLTLREPSERLQRLLQRCVVRVCSGSDRWGTGFFIADHLILTCAHLAHGEASGLSAAWAGKNGIASVSKRGDLERLDVALVSVASTWRRHPCVTLSPDVEAGDWCYIFGFSDQRPNGDPVLVQVEGRVGAMLKLRSGQIRPGHSGSPVLNLRTGYVCGMVQNTRDRAIDLGGIGWVINDEDILRRNRAFVGSWPVWERFRRPHRNERPSWFLSYAKSPTPPVPFCPAWFVFTQRTIDLLGRDRELEALRNFLHTHSPFSWWALYGPAGIGKSRLAHEISLEIESTWYCGFADIASVGDFESWLLKLNRPAFLVVDEASRDLDKVASLLKLCCNLGTSLPHKVRMLLLEREAGEAAEWWRRLLPVHDATSVMFEQHRYAPPLAVPGASGLEWEITKAWLSAGDSDAVARLPERESSFWQKVRQLTDSRPLLLGVAAAAIARQQGQPDMSSMAQLLRPILQREINRWREVSSSPDIFRSAIELISVATLLRGLPLPRADDFLMLVVNSQGTEPSVALVKEKEGLFRLPRFRELQGLSIDLPNVRSVMAVLATILPPDQVKAQLDFVRTLCPPRWALEPALIGEFFLVETWAEQTFYDSSDSLPSVDDSTLQRLLRAALRIAPERLAANLNELRVATRAPAAFARAIVRLANVVLTEPTTPRAEDEREVVSHLLLNSILRIGRERPSDLLFNRLWGALKELADRYSTDRRVGYRYFKGLPSRIRRLDGTDATAARRELLTRAASSLAEIKEHRSDQAELPWAETVLGLGLEARKTGDNTLLAEALQSAITLQDSFPDNVELYQILARFYYVISICIARPDLPADESPKDVQALASRMARPVDVAIESCWVPRRTLINAEIAEDLGWALVNIGWAYCRIGEFGRAAEVSAKVELFASQLENSEITQEMRMMALQNQLPSKLALEALGPAFQTVADARALLPNSITRAVGSYLWMIRAVWEKTLTRGDAEAFRAQFRLFLEDIVMLRDEPETRDWLVGLFGWLVAELTGLVKITELQWAAASVNAVIRRNADHPICQVAWMSVSPVLIGAAADHIEAERLLESAVQIFRARPSETAVCDALIEGAILYWVRFGRRLDQRISGVCDIKVVSVKGSEQTDIEVQVLDGAQKVIATKQVVLCGLKPIDGA